MCFKVNFRQQRIGVSGPLRFVVLHNTVVMGWVLAEGLKILQGLREAEPHPLLSTASPPQRTPETYFPFRRPAQGAGCRHGCSLAPPQARAKRPLPRPLRHPRRAGAAAPRAPRRAPEFQARGPPDALGGRRTSRPARPGEGLE